MLKPSDLRLGNLIASWENGGRGKPVHVTPRIIKTLFDLPPASDYLMFKAIELSKEVIEKCGFKKCEDWTEDMWNYELDLGNKLAPSGSNSYKFVALGTPHREKGKMYACFTVNDFWASKKVDTLHGLQNQYFYIIGEEIKIDL